MKNANSKNIKEITSFELSKIEANDKLSKLERELSKERKVISEYKEREKQSARALILLERKLRYLNHEVSESLRKLFEEVISDDEKDKISDIISKIHSLSAINESDREFILNKKTITSNKTADIDSRFNKLKQEFEQKIGTSVLRKPGRPKKEDQSILAGMGFRQNVEKHISEVQEKELKLSEIFESAPKKSGVVSVIPDTDDSLFDFNEALNPDLSLKDIMADLMGKNTKK